MRKFKVIECGKIWHPEVVHVGKVIDIYELIEYNNPPSPEDFNGTVEELNELFSKKNQGNWYQVFEEIYE